MPDRKPARAASRLDRTDLRRSALILLAFAVTLGGLHTILDGVAWWILCTVLCLAVFGAGTIVRTVLAAGSILARILAPVAGLLVAAVVVMVRFGSGSGIAGVLPTSDTVEVFRKLIRDAGYSITWQNVPANADDAISFVLALGVIALAVVAEIAAFSLRLPALVGIPLAVIFLVPGMTPEGKTDGWFFAASALAYLSLLIAGRPRHVIPAVAVGAIAVVSGLILPGALPSTDITATSNGLGPSVSTGVNPVLHLGDDLRQGDKHIALTYSTVSGEPEYLRLAEISDFFSKDWGPSQPNLDPRNRPVEFPRPPGLDVGVTTDREVSYIHVANLVSPWLPVPYPASSVTGLTGSWQYLPESFTVASNLTLARGENYTVASVKLEPTPQQLLAAGTRVPADLANYLVLPPDTPEIIASTATKVTTGDSSNYQKALALQEYLRSAPFHYSETAPVTDGYDGTGVEYVAAFLKEQSGYCIHFASAMAVMARELGIPSRIIVGFQPGSLQNGEDRGRKIYAVTTHDLHAWPELYFSGIGWVRFEPTPSRGSVPDYANQTTAGVPPVTVGGSGPSSPSKGDHSGAPQIDEGPTVTRWLTSGDWSAWFAIAGILALLVFLIFLPALVRSLRRRRRLSRLASGRGTVASAWREIIETAEDIGIVIPPTLTPREAVARLDRVRGMSGGAGESLARVGLALEREGYGPGGGVSARSAEERRALAADVTAVLSCLSASVDANARAKATMLPRSLVSRISTSVARFG
ncbi:transglutaminase-like putative cysteine protease [Cryobacterium mesophilum]|uniref:transglutaminase TgpA family protein n=1 Tax=Terrimesophilobacter mesophilus TaxID=433647 RepID=UPI0014255077|nr:DUF3488 and transglutaminase-like domain-containing protein [Terrimesophilobacter mesophilus]MBB5632538.1 transglutaminase-like putative cysteine protease [Terrimesophilobacter mesophilus]